MTEFTQLEIDQIKWFTTDLRPPISREEAEKVVLACRTKLWNDLVIENFSTTEWDYGYGGESYEHAATDHTALYDWITERERRLLGGKTLEEYTHELR